MVVDYQSGKIYKLWSPSQNLVYIGSTTQNLAFRKGGHCRDFKKWQNGKFPFMTSFTILECEDNRIDLLEAYPCNNKMELLAREGYWIKKLDCVNKYIPGRTKKEYDKEYYKQNKEEINKQTKEHYIANREKYIKNSKENYKQNKEYRQVKCSCSCGSNFCKVELPRHIKSKKHQNFLNSSTTSVIILVG